MQKLFVSWGLKSQLSLSLWDCCPKCHVVSAIMASPYVASLMHCPMICFGTVGFDFLGLGMDFYVTGLASLQDYGLTVFAF